MATFSSARALLQWCRLESERDSASVEAGTLRRQLAGLRAESERAAQVCFFAISFLISLLNFLLFYVFSFSRVRVLDVSFGEGNPSFSHFRLF